MNNKINNQKAKEVLMKLKDVKEEVNSKGKKVVTATFDSVVVKHDSTDSNQ